MSTTSRTTALRELGRFFTVSARRFTEGHIAPEMFSTAIDAEWHRLLKSPEYTEFSQAHAGQVLGHVPVKGSGEIGWVSAYEAAYGKLPEVWFTREDGSVDTEALNRYQETGIVVAEWDCTPTGGDDEAAPKTREKAAA
ncbi:hypothetical protein J7E95_38780 [Streptomyces sp. ISL-14]|nr:hypothetical protein [Streptomyces sp. ISL-14]